MFPKCFCGGKTNLAAALIANEANDSLLKSNDCGLIYKLDIKNAYDHVNWNSLLLVLNKMSFGEKLIDWCISTMNF